MVKHLPAPNTIDYSRNRLMRGSIRYWGSGEWAAICWRCHAWGRARNIPGNPLGLFDNGSTPPAEMVQSIVEQGWRKPLPERWVCPECAADPRLALALIVIQEGLGL